MAITEYERTVYGADLDFYRRDPWGRKMLKQMMERHKGRLKVLFSPHKCHWMAVKKHSDSGFLPPPRMICMHGFPASAHTREKKTRMTED
jgi:hypothetical protein